MSSNRWLLFISIIMSIFMMNTAMAMKNTYDLLDPHDVIKKFNKTIYVTGETTGNFTKIFQNEHQAANRIHEIITSNQQPERLIAKNKHDQTPLMLASYMGNVIIVEALLKADGVRKEINHIGRDGLSAWGYAALAMRQTKAVCNPLIKQEPLALVPWWVSLTYYTSQKENPYITIMHMLEKHGAIPDMEKARKHWLKSCKHQEESTRRKVEQSSNITATLIAETDQFVAIFLEDIKEKVKKIKKNP